MADLNPTGSVYLRHFDAGLVTTLGAEIMQHSVRGVTLSDFFLPANLLRGEMSYPGTGPSGAVRIVFADPEETLVISEIPGVYVRRGDPQFNGSRWHPKTKEYRVPAPDAVAVRDDAGVIIGYTKYESKEWARPHDIPYDITVVGRTRSDAQLLLERVQRVYIAPAGTLVLKDSRDEERQYEAFVEGVASADELESVGERVVGFTISIRVEGELDLRDPVYDTAVTQSVIRVDRK